VETVNCNHCVSAGVDTDIGEAGISSNGFVVETTF
jgi:hypothetical protein